MGSGLDDDGVGLVPVGDKTSGGVLAIVDEETSHGMRHLTIGQRRSAVQRMLAVTAGLLEERREEARVLERRSAALEALVRSHEDLWRRARWASGWDQWRKAQLQAWGVRYKGFRVIVFAPVTVVASLLAAIVGLSRWEQLHAEDGYAEPPRNLWRCIVLWRQARWSARATYVMALFAAAATWGILEPEFSSSDPKAAALAAAAWLLLLAVPGELAASLRGRMRAALWSIEFVLWIAFESVGEHSAVIDGVRLSASADLVGLVLISLLLWAREWPVRAG